MLVKVLNLGLMDAGFWCKINSLDTVQNGTSWRNVLLAIYLRVSLCKVLFRNARHQVISPSPSNVFARNKNAKMQVVGGTGGLTASSLLVSHTPLKVLPLLWLICSAGHHMDRDCACDCLHHTPDGNPDPGFSAAGGR